MAVHLAAASLEVGLAAASLEALDHEFGVRGVDLKEVSAGPMMFLAVVASINTALNPHKTNIWSLDGLAKVHHM